MRFLFVISFFPLVIHTFGDGTHKNYYYTNLGAPPDNETVIRTKVKRGICLRDHDFICNSHNPNLTCTCYQYDSSKPLQYAKCDQKFQLMDPSTNVLRFKSPMPAHPRYIDFVDEMFVKVIADTAAIDKSNIFILRKTCNSRFMYLYFGIIHDLSEVDFNNIRMMDTSYITPRIFLSNRNLMEQVWVPAQAIDKITSLPEVVCQKCEWYRQNMPNTDIDTQTKKAMLETSKKETFWVEDEEEKKTPGLTNSHIAMIVGASVLSLLLLSILGFSLVNYFCKKNT
ncbi:unnamed protein product [Bursaphelenchus xylophilus]|nr:unnamed protein product [Bursaphelenchus xylophilus]CAG9116449.1 unnamed protein product [Bursaphelenchus xylophilus]